MRLLWVLAGVVLVRQALGDEPNPEDRAAANALFEDARKLMADGKFADACPKLQASLQLVNQLGTELNLAECWEKAGRTATAWGEWQAAATMAKKANDPREALARQRADDLEPKLTRLLVKVADGEPAGLVVKRDGDVLGRAFFGTGIPVNPGDHLVEATAPKLPPWSQHVTATAPGTVEVDVPILGAPVAIEPPPTPPKEPPPPARPIIARDEKPSSSGHRVVAVTVGGVGLALVGTSVVLGLLAESSYSTAVKDHCTDGATLMCDPTGIHDVNGARSMGTAGIVTAVVGGAAIAAGIVLYLTAPSPGAAKTALVPTGNGLAIVGSF